MKPLSFATRLFSTRLRSLCLALLTGLFMAQASNAAHGPDNHSTIFHLPIGAGEIIDFDLNTVLPIPVDMESTSSYAIVHDPVEGVVTIGEEGVARYRHGGASPDPDSFTVGIVDLQGELIATRLVQIDIIANVVSVKILFPAQGEQIVGNTVVVKYAVSGDNYDHLHLALDNTTHISLYENSGTHTFNDVEPGDYTLLAQLANSRHQRINGPNAEQRVNFSVVAE